MARSTGYVLAAGGIVIANDMLTVHDINDHNLWRVVPATAVMALMLGGIESLAPAFGAGLGMLVLLSVLVIPYGKAPTPLDNISKLVRYPK